MHQNSSQMTNNNGNSIWNPNFFQNDEGQQQQQQEQQQQQQQQQKQEVKFAFNNPWDSNGGNQNDYSTGQVAGDAAGNTGHVLYSPNHEMIMETPNEDFENFKRRKSSLVIPPTRAGAPNPFQYENYPTYNSMGQNTSSINSNGDYGPGGASSSAGPGTALSGFNPSMGSSQQQRQSLFNKQQQQQQHLNTRFVPNLYNQQNGFQRRQSMAATAFTTPQYTTAPSTAGNTTSNFGNNAGTVGPNGHFSTNMANSSSAGKLQNVQSGMNPNFMGMSSVSPYRRLSAFPTSSGGMTSATPTTSTPFPQQFAPLREEKPTIPQMSSCKSKSELSPTVNKTPKYRRASVHSQTISPLNAMTKNLITTYQLCSPDFIYKTSKNPKRVLTKPSEGKCNNGYDNVNSDYILYVNDVLGVEQNRKYLVLDILGQGTFGQVVKCQNLQTKEILAVKVIKSRSEYLNQSITEAKILELINTKIDPNNVHHFLRMHDSFVHKNHLCLVFELLSNNLYELLKQNQYHGLSMQLIKIFTKQMLDSLCVLKDSKLIHCDLKPENILLCSPDKPDIKIIDFGSSCEEARTVYTYIQSRFYRAPEIILGIPYSSSIDMWSLGCIVAELFLGIPIFPGSSEFNQITRIVNTVQQPPNWMLDMGKNTSKFMHKLEPWENRSELGSKYRLKTLDEFNRDFKDANEKPGKQYFKWEKLQDIIKNYRIPKNIQHSQELIDQEMANRACLLHFLTGILNLNPLERWAPQQAAQHPFITNQPFTGEWYPPGTLQSIQNTNTGSSAHGHSERSDDGTGVNPAGHVNGTNSNFTSNNSNNLHHHSANNDNSNKINDTTPNENYNNNNTNNNNKMAAHNHHNNLITNHYIPSPPGGTTKKFTNLTIREE